MSVLFSFIIDLLKIIFSSSGFSVIDLLGSPPIDLWHADDIVLLGKDADKIQSFCDTD